MNSMIRGHLACLILAGGSAASAQSPTAQPAEIPLYPGVAPGSEKWDWQEKSVTRPNGMPIVTDVVRPVLLHYPAEKGKAVGTAMVVAPGGGFRALMMSYEGADIARRLNAMGVDAFVLKYRLIHERLRTPRPGRRSSSWRARTAGRPCGSCASKAGEFGYRPDRVGMIGFSAGGMVTSDALFGPAETRPDFAAIIYGAREVKEIPAPAPPLFLAVAADDAGFGHPDGRPVHGLSQGEGAGRAARLPDGAHGFVNKGGGADHFMDRLEEWLRANKLLTKAEAGSPAS